MMPETWIVLGASSAIGRALAREAARRGADVVLAGRDLDDLALSAADITATTGRAARAVHFDAVAFATHPGFVAAMAEIPGKLVIVCVFGVMPDQAAIDADPALAQICIEGNFSGAVSMLHRFAAVLESRRGGAVIGIGSVAGDRGRLKNYVYGATKAAMHTYLAGLRNRLGRAGVTVLTVKPGFVDTAMTFGLPGLFLVAQPEDVAHACAEALERNRNEIYVPWFWWGIMTIIRAIPEAVFKRLSI